MDHGYDVYEYSRRGLLVELREALKSGSGPDDYMAYDGSTAVVMAARAGHCEVVRELLLARASPFLHTDDGSSLLCHAVSGRCASTAAEILQAGVNVNEPNVDGVTPLILAAYYDLPAIAKLFISAGADINAEADGWGTALDNASAGSETASLLESVGAKRSDKEREQPLAKGDELFTYGCFESGALPETTATSHSFLGKKAPVYDGLTQRPAVGDLVRLRVPKSGLLKDDELGEVVVDDGSDCVPLKVRVGDAFDYYDYADVLVVESAAKRALPADSDRATVEGTLRYLTSKLDKRITPNKLGNTSLSLSPLGFGCHRLTDNELQRAALSMAIKLGCNVVDLAPNYSDGVAETVAGEVLGAMFEAKEVRRDEIVVLTKVGNILGQQRQYIDDVPNIAQINDDLYHCISPPWIEQELERSLERLNLKCIDCLLLHCPEVEAKAPDVDLSDVYSRLRVAFEHLEKEVSRGRIAFYGVSAAFYPVRPSDPEHLDLHEVVRQLPIDHHFRVLQFPLNFAEAQIRWVGHVPRKPDGSALDQTNVADALTFFEAAKQYGFATLTNRPLDGIYKESHGVLRFSSLDCDVRSFSELQLDNCDSLEEKLDSLCGFASEGGQLAAKTVKVLTSLEGVDCVLLGMRQPDYVLSAVPLSFGLPRLDPAVADKAFRAVNQTIEMWFATAIHESDHGTSKHWRLPNPPVSMAGA